MGVDETTLGESKRKTYYIAYVAPGEHKIWWARDGKIKPKYVTTMTMMAGKQYYFQAMGAKLIDEDEGIDAMKECKQIRSVDLTKRGREDVE